MRIELPADAKAADSPVRVLDSQTLKADLRAAAGTKIAWRLTTGQTLLGEGVVQADPAGAASVSLSFPQLRHRTRCLLRVQAGESAVDRTVIVLPGNDLASAAKRVAALGVGVVDRRGRVQAALSAQGIVAADLNLRRCADAFTGGLVIVAGPASVRGREALMASLRGRIEGGMDVLLLHPPAGGLVAGRTAGLLGPTAELPEPIRGPFGLDKRLSRSVSAEDLGEGSRRRTLASGPAIRPLIWIAAQADALATRPAGPRAILAASETIGRGRLTVCLLDASDDPLGDAAGRGVLNGLILWILDQRAVPDAEPSQ